MSRTFSVKFVCTECATKVYKVTKNVNVDKQWCSPCSQGKSVQNLVKQPQNDTQLAQEKPYTEFNPVIAAEKDILYYLRLLHKTEE